MIHATLTNSCFRRIAGAIPMAVRTTTSGITGTRYRTDPRNTACINVKYTIGTSRTPNKGDQTGYRNKPMIARINSGVYQSVSTILSQTLAYPLACNHGDQVRAILTNPNFTTRSGCLTISVNARWVHAKSRRLSLRRCIEGGMIRSDCRGPPVAPE